MVRSYIGNSLLEESVQTALKRLEGRMLLLRDDKELGDSPSRIVNAAF